MCPNPNILFGKEMTCTTEPLKGINTELKKEFFFKNEMLSHNYIVVVIILYINCGHQGVINILGIEITFECTLSFYFHFQFLHIIWFDTHLFGYIGNQVKYMYIFFQLKKISLS